MCAVESDFCGYPKQGRQLQLAFINLHLCDG